MVDEDNVITKILYENAYIRIQKVNVNNSAIKDKEYKLKSLIPNTEGIFFLKVKNYMIIITRHWERDKGRYYYKLARINLHNLEFEIVTNRLFEHERLDHGIAQKIFFCTSPDESKFFIGYHNMLVRDNIDKNHTFKFCGNVYDEEEDLIYTAEYEFQEPKDHIRDRDALAKISNQGVVILRHVRKNKVLIATPETNELIESDINQQLFELDPNFKFVSEFRSINADENLFAFTYSSEWKRYFQSGVALCSVNNKGEVIINKFIKMPTNVVSVIKNTKYRESGDCIRDAKDGTYHLFNWRISDFEKLDQKYILFLEYNLVGSSYGPTTYGGSYIRNGELLIFNIDNNFEGYSYKLIPKLSHMECNSSNCGSQQSRAAINGYSLFNTGTKISLFYWGNILNDSLMTNDKPTKRVVHHVYTYIRKNNCVFRVDLSPEGSIKHYNLGSYDNFIYSPLLNHGIIRNNDIIFRSTTQTFKNTLGTSSLIHYQNFK